MRTQDKILTKRLRDSAFDFMPQGEHHITVVYERVKSHPDYSSLCDETPCKHRQGKTTQREWQHCVQLALEALKAKRQVMKGPQPRHWTFFTPPLQQSRIALAQADFNPGNIEDERKKTLREIEQRRGQPDFRRCLLVAYGRRCCVTGCDAVDALEASHIDPYRESQSNHVTNGLLLRSDIHTLFDLYLIGIDPKTLRVAIAKRLRRTCYGELNGQKLQVPRTAESRPSFESLQLRWKRFDSDRAE